MSKQIKYPFRLFCQEPPISMEVAPEVFEFEHFNFDSAYNFSKEWVKKNKKEGTLILMLARLER